MNVFNELLHELKIFGYYVFRHFRLQKAQMKSLKVKSFFKIVHLKQSISDSLDKYFLIGT